MISEAAIPGQLAPFVFDVWRGRNAMVRGHGRGKLLASRQSRNKPTEKGTRDEITLHRMSSPKESITSQRCHLVLNSPVN